MSIPDPTHAAALDEPIIKPVFFAWLDINGDPVRANTAGKNITPTGSGDPDLDDYEFLGLDHRLVTISPVRFRPGGSESVTAELSGIPGLDDETIALLADRANWQGRDARLWRIVRNAANVQQGGFHAYYTGKMTNLTHGGAPDAGLTLTVTIEGYLSALSEASNRTYLDQAKYDSGDESARAAIAIANGNYGNAPTSSPNGAGGGGYYGGGRFYDPREVQS